MRTYIATIGRHNAARLTTDYRREIPSSALTDLGDGCIELTDLAIEILAEEPDHHNGHVSGGCIWIDGEGYLLTEQQ